MDESESDSLNDSDPLNMSSGGGIPPAPLLSLVDANKSGVDE